MVFMLTIFKVHPFNPVLKCVFFPLWNNVTRIRKRETDMPRLTWKLGTDLFSYQYAMLNQSFQNTRVEIIINGHQMMMHTWEDHAVRLNCLGLVSMVTARWFDNSGVLELLLSAGTPSQSGTGPSWSDRSWSDRSWRPWPSAHGVSGEAATNTGCCVTSSKHTTLSEKNIPGFLSEVGNSASRREKKVSFSIFSISVSLKISSSNTSQHWTPEFRSEISTHHLSYCPVISFQELSLVKPITLSCQLVFKA